MRGFFGTSAVLLLLVGPAFASASSPEQSKDKDEAPKEAQPVADLDVAPLTGPPTEAELRRSLEARARYLRVGNERGAATELELLEETRLALGARNVVLASAVLIRETQQAMDTGRLERALSLANAAARLSPDLVAAHWNRARAYALLGASGWRDVAGAMFDLVAAKLTRFRNVVTLLTNLFVILGIALFVTIMAWTLIQLLKYLSYPSHDLAKKLPAFAGPGEVAIALLMLIALPGILGFGLTLVVILALVTVIGYQTSREQWVSLVLMGVLGIGPGLIFLTTPFLAFPGSRADFMEMAVTEAFADEAESALGQRTDSGDVSGALILAVRSRIRGDLEGAVLHYQKALSINPNDDGARNNLGIAYVMLGREEAALESFRQASARKTLAQPLLNQATIFADSSHFDEANALLDQARHIDEDLTEQYTRMDASVPMKSKMLAAELGQGILWSRLLSLDGTNGRAVTVEEWRRVGGRTPALFMPLIVLVAAVFSVRLIKRSRRLSTPCPKCGAPAHREAPARHCVDCEAVFLAPTPVDVRLRRARERIVVRYQRKRRWAERLLGLCAGAGHILGDRAVGGVSLLFFFAACLACAISHGSPTADAWSIWMGGDDASLITIVCLAVAGFLSLFSLRQVWR